MYQDSSCRNTPIEHSAEAIPAQHGLGLRIANLVIVVVPFLGFIAALLLLWGTAVDWVHLALLVVMYLATGLGITVGFHRLFTHKSFEAVKPLKALLGVLGSMAVEGPVIAWAAMHRQHHQHSDSEMDPHSPHAHGGEGTWAMLKGFWHAHMGWLISRPDMGSERYVPDLLQDKIVRNVSRLFPLWVVLGLIIPAVLGGLLTLSWTGVLLGFLWGGLARIFLVHHVTWSVNSVCHLWGSRPFRSNDHSRNNAIMGVLAMGEGWHNNHHAFPTSARHGLRWWQFDLSYCVIKVLEACRLARAVRVPSPERIAAKRA
jgi:stearoyl-CoA desaturase (Delta-9 desaturase)